MSDNEIKIGQIRQRVLGDASNGTTVYRIMSKDWVFADKWIIQDMIGQLARLDSNIILDHHIRDDLNAS